MSDDNQSTAQKSAPTQQFKINKIYLKDASFESPGAPELFTTKAKWEPQVNIQINTETRAATNDIHEVVLGITVTAKNEDKIAYLVEIKQSGLFLIKGFEPTQRDHLLGSHCPGSLFPYAREAISALVAKGGFPQMMLEPINFDALYAQRLEQLKQNAPAPTTSQ